MNKLLSLIFFHSFFCLTLSWSQTKISGRIIDANTQLPIEYATIYISGTSNGTISDTSGYYHLERIIAPCQLVVSHISYNLAMLYIDYPKNERYNFQLSAKEVEIKQVNITDINLREKNIEQFHNLFLGSDVWGRNASIENPEILRFKREYIQDEIQLKDKSVYQQMQKLYRNLQWSNDSTVSFERPIKMEVFASGPILIELPLLGYKLFVNLVNFNWVADSVTSFLGYYYYQPLAYESKRDSIRINRNRKKAYYHSLMHFGHSLSKNQLAENGYRVLEKKYDMATEMSKWEDLHLDSFLIFKENHVEVFGLKDKVLRIIYYQMNETTPSNLTSKKRSSDTRFFYKLKLLKDTCIIRSDGTIPDNSIQFGPVIGNKLVGAFLLDNYIEEHF